MRSRQGLKALVLCAMALGMMAIGAGAAQATPTWMVAGANLAAGLEPEVGGELEGGTASLLATINGLDLELLCGEGELTGVKLLPGDKTNSTGDVTFKKCVAYSWDLNAKGEYETRLTTACEPHTEGQPVGTILTEPGFGLILLHIEKLEGGVEHKVPVVLIQANNAENRFATVLMGSKCAFPELIPIFGLFYIKDCKKLGETEEVKHLIEELKALSTLTVINKKATNAARIDGSAWAFLKNAHLNQKWSVLAE
jgi:hypothetical protein